MALTEKKEYKYEILPNGSIQEREKTLIMRDGVVIADTNHRRVIEAGDDVSMERAELQGLAGVVHTPERVEVVRVRKVEEKAVRDAEVEVERVRVEKLESREVSE